MNRPDIYTEKIKSLDQIKDRAEKWERDFIGSCFRNIYAIAGFSYNQLFVVESLYEKYSNLAKEQK